MEKPQDDRKDLKKQLENAERNVNANIERLKKSLVSDEDSSGDKIIQKLPKKVSCINLYLIFRCCINVILHRPILH